MKGCVFNGLDSMCKKFLPGVDAVGVVEAEDCELEADDPMTIVSPPDPLPGRPALPASLGVDAPPVDEAAQKGDF